jgi:hypothetical protein
MPLGNRVLTAPPRNTLKSLAERIHRRVLDCIEEMGEEDERVITITAPESILCELQIIATAFNDNSEGYSFSVEERPGANPFMYYFHVETTPPRVDYFLDKPNDWVPEFIGVDD